VKIYVVIILFLYLFKEGFEYSMQYLNLRYMKRFGLSIPPEFEGQIDEGLLKKTQAYEVEKTRFSFISSMFGNVITIAFFFGGILDMYNSWVLSLNLSFILS
jgi:STE24 endopeptidase